jgi:hypothetical protein
MNQNNDDAHADQDGGRDILPCPKSITNQGNDDKGFACRDMVGTSILPSAIKMLFHIISGLYSIRAQPGTSGTDPDIEQMSADINWDRQHTLLEGVCVVPSVQE